MSVQIRGAYLEVQFTGIRCCVSFKLLCGAIEMSTINMLTISVFLFRVDH